MRCSEFSEDRLVSFEVIKAATEGDSEALAKVLKHFEGYIAKMFTRVFYDDVCGQSYLRVDEDLKQRIECKLMAQIILKFKI